MELTFGEQIKILLSRSHMTIQELADRYEAATGNKMSRQNLTQRLKRDNFPEQDMRVLAAVHDNDNAAAAQPEQNEESLERIVAALYQQLHIV